MRKGKETYGEKRGMPSLPAVGEKRAILLRAPSLPPPPSAVKRCQSSVSKRNEEANIGCVPVRPRARKVITS